MVAGIQVKFGVVRDEVTPALTRQNKGYRVQDKTIGQIKGSYRALEREAVSALRKTRTEQEKLNRVTKGLKMLVDRNIISQEKMNRTVKETARQLKGQTLGNKLESNIKSTILAYAGLHTAISTATQLLAKQRELEGEGAETQLTIGAAQFRLARNTADFSRQERIDLFQGTERVAAANPLLSRRQAFDVVSRAVGATIGDPGDRTERLLSALEIASTKFPDEPESIKAFTSTILDLQKVTRQVEGFSDADAVELLLRAGGQSRGEDTKNLGRLIPALSAVAIQAQAEGGRVTREDIEQAFAFQAALSGAIVDPTLERTGTASAKAVEVLGEQIPRQLAEGFSNQLQFLIDNPGFARRVQGKVEGRGVAKEPVKAIFGGREGGVRSEFETALDSFKNPRQVQSLEEFLADPPTKELKVLGGTRKTENVVEDLVADKFGDVGFIRKQVGEASKLEGGRGVIDQLRFEILRLIPGISAEGAGAAVTSVQIQREMEKELKGIGTETEETVKALQDIRELIRDTGKPLGTVVPKETEN